jgi:hypothetical protein
MKIGYSPLFVGRDGFMAAVAVVVIADWGLISSHPTHNKKTRNLPKAADSEEPPQPRIAAFG